MCTNYSETFRRSETENTDIVLIRSRQIISCVGSGYVGNQIITSFSQIDSTWTIYSHSFQATTGNRAKLPEAALTHLVRKITFSMYVGPTLGYQHQKHYQAKRSVHCLHSLVGFGSERRNSNVTKRQFEYNRLGWLDFHLKLYLHLILT